MKVFFKKSIATMILATTMLQAAHAGGVAAGGFMGYGAYQATREEGGEFTNFELIEALFYSSLVVSAVGGIVAFTLDKKIGVGIAILSEPGRQKFEEDLIKRYEIERADAREIVSLVQEKRIQEAEDFLQEVKE